MAFTMVFTDAVTTNEGQLAYAKEVSGELKIALDVLVPDSETDFDVLVGIDVSQIQGIYIVSDQDITLETNNGTTPDETISLKANVPYKWHGECYDSNLLATDITALYFTNASGEDATVKIRVVSDPTP